MKNRKGMMLLAALAAVVMPAAVQAQTYGSPIPLRGGVKVSSELDTDRYGYKMIADLNAATCWTEGVDGLGVGETITWTYSENQWIHGMAILPGYQKSSNVYEWNAVPTKLLLTVGSKSMRCTLDGYEPDFDNPTASMRYVDFPEPILASEATVTIEAAREGTKYSDTCISELFFYEYATDSASAGKAKPVIVCDPTKELPYSGTKKTGNAAASQTKGTYILEGSDSRYLSEEELMDLTDEELRIARNELYARHGYIFGNQEMKKYFESQSWYRGTVRASDFDYSKVFNKYEWANLELIVEEEESRQVDSNTMILEPSGLEDFDDLSAGSGEVEDCLAPELYADRTSEDGSFSFLYPFYLFNEREFEENDYQFFYFDEEDELIYALYVYKYEDEGYALTRVADLFEERQEDYESTFMTHVSSGIGADGFAHAVIGGYLDDEETEGLYQILANDGEESYVLEFHYADPDAGDEYSPVNYIIDTLYRGCSFSGSTYRPRTYDQFQDDEVGTKK